MAGRAKAIRFPHDFDRIGLISTTLSTVEAMPPEAVMFDMPKTTEKSVDVRRFYSALPALQLCCRFAVF